MTSPLLQLAKICSVPMKIWDVSGQCGSAGYEPGAQKKLDIKQYSHDCVEGLDPHWINVTIKNDPFWSFSGDVCLISHDH